MIRQLFMNFFPKCFSSFSDKCKARGFTVIVDGRKSQWNVVKTVVLMLQVKKFLYVHI